MSLDRRTFLRFVLGLMASPYAALSLASSTPTASSAEGLASDGLGARLDPPNASPDALIALLSDPASASSLGQRYLSDQPHERDTNRLADQLLAALSVQQPGQPLTDPRELGQALIALVQREYVSEPLIAVDGWLLAPSEARLYALAAVIMPPQRADRPASFAEAHQRRSPGRAGGIAG